MKSRTVNFLLENHFVSPIAALLVLFGAIATASVPLLIVAGVMAYGWPFLYGYLLDIKTTSETVEKAPAKRLTVIRPSTVGAL